MPSDSKHSPSLLTYFSSAELRSTVPRTGKKTVRTPTSGYNSEEKVRSGLSSLDLHYTISMADMMGTSASEASDKCTKHGILLFKTCLLLPEGGDHTTRSGGDEVNRASPYSKFAGRKIFTKAVEKKFEHQSISLF